MFQQCTDTVTYQYAQGRIQHLPKGVGHEECGARANNGGLQAEPPAGSRGRAPGVPEGQHTKPFVHFHTGRSKS